MLLVSGTSSLVFVVAVMATFVFVIESPWSWSQRRWRHVTLIWLFHFAAYHVPTVIDEYSIGAVELSGADTEN